MLQSKIITVLLLICSFCKGQTFTKLSDSTALYGGDTIRTNEIAKSWHFIDAINSENRVQYDTIKCEMLITSTDETNNKVVKIIGYEVGYEYHDNDCGNCPTFWKHVEYLDIVKKPIRNIHVWLSNQLNKNL